MRTIGERINTQDEFYRRLADKIKVDIRVAIPGIVQSFDPVEQTVTVQPAIRERVRDSDGNMQYVDLPLLLDVPVVFPRAGGFVLTMPVNPGDECLVVFADMCIDAWWSNSGVQNQIEKRRHDLSDAFAILGTWSQPRVVSGYSSDSAQLRTEDGQTCIALKNGEISLNANNIAILPAGKGIKFTSPNGAVTRTLTIDNNGNPVWS
jgi:hypothetical protein